MRTGAGTVKGGAAPPAPGTFLLAKEASESSGVFSPLLSVKCITARLLGCADMPSGCMSSPNQVDRLCLSGLVAALMVPRARGESVTGRRSIVITLFLKFVLPGCGSGLHGSSMGQQTERASSFSDTSGPEAYKSHSNSPISFESCYVRHELCTHGPVLLKCKFD